MGLHDLGFKLTDADLTSIMAVTAPGMRSVGFFLVGRWQCNVNPGLINP